MKTSPRAQGLRVVPDGLYQCVGFIATGLGAISLTADAGWVRLLVAFVLAGVGMHIVDHAYQRGEIEVRHP